MSWALLDRMDSARARASLVVVAMALLVGGCGDGLTPSATATPTPTVSRPVPSATVIPEGTPALSPTPTPTLRPTPSVAPLPTPTATPVTLPTPGAAGTLLVSVGRGRFTVEIADDQAERTMGLSERDALAADAGMWFDEGTERIASFWMRGMRFPLDFVWVDAALRVVEVTHDVPPPEQGTADADIPRFGAAVPVRFALEINAGLARALEIGPGDVVRLDVP